MKYFLAKAEPEDDFSIEDLQKVGVEPWNGVHSYQAVNVIKSWSIGDQVFFYHSGKERAISGLMEVVSQPEKDLEDQRNISWFANVKFVERYAPEDRISLKEIKATGKFKDFSLIKQSRLSVMECPEEFVDWFFKEMKIRKK